jgi:hypothetical protein
VAGAGVAPLAGQLAGAVVTARGGHQGQARHRGAGGQDGWRRVKASPRAAHGQARARTYTGVPSGTMAGNQPDAVMGMRTHPWEAGWAGTDGKPWMAMPPLKYSGL